MTGPREAYLKALAEKLGLTIVSVPLAGKLYGKSGYIPDINWLATWEGTKYLIQRAREKGYRVDTYRLPAENTVPHVRNYVIVYKDDPDVQEGHGQDESEEWATAYSVGRIYGLEPPEEEE